jgi:two-component system, LytTR family, response regulator
MTTKIQTIIVDDEESARDVIKNLLVRFCPDIEIVAICKSVPEAVESIKIHQPQLVFLDIEMPNYAGFEIVNFFPEVNFDIVFITAYEQYAIKAFEISAIDYLLKPIEIDRLKKAVEKVKLQVVSKIQKERLEVLTETINTKKIRNLVIQDKGEQIVCSLEEVIAFEAQESYCMVHTTTKKYIQSKNLKHFENLLDENPEFLRIHKSWIINKKHVLKYSKSELNVFLTNSIIAKLSKYKKQEFEQEVLNSLM